MATEYKIRFYNAAGTLQHEVTDFLELAYTKEVNSPGLMTFTISGEHALIGDIDDKWQVEVWRRNKSLGIDWYADYYGLFRSQRQAGVRPGEFQGRCPGILSMLGWRVVAWAAGTADRSKFTAVEAETVLKTLVSYNAGTAATTGNGRIRTGTITNLLVEADGTDGNVIDIVCAGQNLLEVLQDVALIAGGDFDLVKTDVAEWEFRYYDGQLGTDRTATVIFAIGYDNMSNPEFAIERGNERTVAIVAGQGEGAAREFAVVTGVDYDVTANNLEMFVDARDIDAGDTDALTSRGNTKLEERRALEMFAFDVQQTWAVTYGRDYFMGDLVTAVSPFTGASATKKIQAVTVALDSSRNEQIGIGLRDV